MGYVKITRSCAYCDKNVTRSPSLMKGKNIFCNRVCQKLFYQERANTGSSNPNWKGGKRITDSGYIRIRNQNHPRAVNGYVLEHILVMEEKLGRPLKEGERIHHINHNPADNRAENLKLYSSNGKHLKEEGHSRKKHSPCPCGKPHKGHGLCARHLRQFRKTGKTWDFENKYLDVPQPGQRIGHRFASRKICPCGEKAKSRGLCSAHYQYLIKYKELPQFGIKLG